jgi:DNA-binding NarL/FixJ family response regulator
MPIPVVRRRSVDPGSTRAGHLHHITPHLAIEGPMDALIPNESAVAAAAVESSVSGAPVTVLIVIEVCLYREGLARTLGGWPSVAVVGSAAGVAAAIAAVRESRPQVILLDPQMEGARALVRQVGEMAPQTRMVALGVREVEQDVLPCAEAGMAGYVPRDGSLADLVAAIESAAHGELRCSPKIAASLFQRVARLSGEAQRPTAPLTRREEEIARLLDQGLTNKQIARRLQIGVSTVKNHVHSVLKKLQTTRRTLVAARSPRPPS